MIFQIEIYQWMFWLITGYILLIVVSVLKYLYANLKHINLCLHISIKTILVVFYPMYSVTPTEIHLLKEAL